MPSNDAEDCLALISSRRSVRRYRPDPVPDEMLYRLFAAAITAPSAHNRQPWRFVVLTAEADKSLLAKAMAQRLVEDRGRDGDDPDDIQRDAERSIRYITGAPVVVLVAMTLAEMDRYPDERRMQAEYLMAVQGTAMATQNLLLAAHALGLGACWRCAPLFCGPDVVTALSLSADWQPQGLVTLGYPLAAGPRKPRKAVDEVVLR